MPNLGDITLRTDALCKKYEKYVETGKGKEAGRSKKGKSKGADAFAETYEEIFSDVMALIEKAEELTKEKNRAAVAERNAYMRRAKAAILQTDIPKLQKLVRKGKKVSKEMIEEREQLVQKLIHATNEIRDGVTGIRKPMRPAKSARESAGKEVVISGFDAQSYSNPAYYEKTEESTAFRSEWEEARKQQDSVLDEISNGLAQLKNMGQAMQEELDRQDPLLDGIEEKVDSVNHNMSSNNRKLANTVYQVRSTRKICIDVILITCALMFAFWIYASLAKAGVF